MNQDNDGFESSLNPRPGQPRMVENFVSVRLGCLKLYVHVVQVKQMMVGVCKLNTEDPLYFRMINRKVVMKLTSSSRLRE